jgi:hypothetical protein
MQSVAQEMTAGVMVEWALRREAKVRARQHERTTATFSLQAGSDSIVSLAQAHFDPLAQAVARTC